MFTFVALLVAFCWGLIVISRRASRIQVVGIIAKSVLVAVASWFVWSVLVMGGFVRVDPLLRWLGGDDAGQPWVASVLLAPPILAAIAFGLWAAKRSHAGSRTATPRR